MIAECLLIKNENRYLLEHLTYNAAAGIDHFFIYDNLSDTPVVDYLRENAREFLNICTITRYHSNNNLQLDCYADYLRKYRNVDWTVFCDTDECFTGNIRDAVAEYGGNYNCLLFSPILHGCNGKIYDNGGGMFERFESDVINPAHHWYKLLSRTNSITFQGVHDNKMISQKIIRVSRENCQCVLHHFRFRSFEEWIAKIKRGVAFNCSKNQHKIKEFFEFNRNLSANNPDVISVMKRYDVTLQTLQTIPVIL